MNKGNKVGLQSTKYTNYADSTLILSTYYSPIFIFWIPNFSLNLILQLWKSPQLFFSKPISFHPMKIPSFWPTHLMLPVSATFSDPVFVNSSFSFLVPLLNVPNLANAFLFNMKVWFLFFFFFDFWFFLKYNLFGLLWVEYKVHAYNREGLCALSFMDDHYPVRSAFSLLNQVFSPVL